MKLVSAGWTIACCWKTADVAIELKEQERWWARAVDVNNLLERLINCFFSAKQVPKFCKPDWFALSEATTGLFLDLSIVPSGGIRTTIRGLGWFLDGNAGATKLHGWVQLDEACPNCLWYHQIFEAAWSWDVCSSRMRTKVSCRRVCRKKMSDKTSFS